MPNNYFKFKQFTIQQERAAFKVGTDGVLLGAWANCSNANTILDIGSGTGLIPLMLAQRCNAEIYALEIQQESYEQGLDNFKNSPWIERIKAIHTDFNDYQNTCQQSFDLIVSNPPYFINSLANQSESKSITRHNDNLSQESILQGTKKLLNPRGSLCLVLPYVEGNLFIAQAIEYGIYCNKKLNIVPAPGKEIKRVLLEFGFRQEEFTEKDIIIEKHGRHKYSDEYKTLTRDFYLAF